MGQYEIDGDVCELFMRGSKTGTDIDWMCLDMAVVTSKLLQYGCPLDEVYASLVKDEQGSPITPLGVLVREILKGKD